MTTKPATPLISCKARVWNGWSSVSCSKKVSKDGFCSTHHPEAVAARKAKMEEKWKAKRALWDQKAQQQKEMRRRYDAYPQLVEALRKALLAIPMDNISLKF